MVLAEHLFQVDSEAVPALAELFAEDARGDVRWRLALAGMDRLLDDLGFDLQTRLLVLHRIRDSFAAEFQVDADFRHQLVARFRAERRGVERLLNPGLSRMVPWPRGWRSGSGARSIWSL